MYHDYWSVETLIHLHHWHLYMTKQNLFGLLQQWREPNRLITGGLTWSSQVDTVGVVTFSGSAGISPAGAVFNLYIQKGGERRSG